MLTDPAYFRAEGDFYDPAAHLATLLSFDRLVAGTLSSVVNDPRGKYVRRLALFDVLEILEGLGQGGYDQLCNWEVQRAAVDELRPRLPEPVSRLLLPRCERAINALEETAGGFLPERRTASGDIKAANKHGGTDELRPARAVALYLRAVRNATHSYRKVVSELRSASLLAGHDGEIPERVSDLAALHMLRLLVDPVRIVPRAVRLGVAGTPTT